MRSRGTEPLTAPARGPPSARPPARPAPGAQAGRSPGPSASLPASLQSTILRCLYPRTSPSSPRFRRVASPPTSQPKVLCPRSGGGSFRFQRGSLDRPRPTWPAVSAALRAPSAPGLRTVPPALTFSVLSFCSLHRRRPGRVSRHSPEERETQSYLPARLPGGRRAPARTGPAVTRDPDPATPAPRPRPGPLPGGPRWWPTCFMNRRRGAGPGRPPARASREAGPVTRARAAPGRPPPPRAPAGRRRRLLRPLVEGGERGRDARMSARLRWRQRRRRRRR